jgi:hypothetical protein
MDQQGIDRHRVSFLSVFYCALDSRFVFAGYLNATCGTVVVSIILFLRCGNLPSKALSFVKMQEAARRLHEESLNQQYASFLARINGASTMAIVSQQIIQK